MVMALFMYSGLALPTILFTPFELEFPSGAKRSPAISLGP